MKLKSFGIWSALALLVATTTACQKTSPTRPSDDGASGTSASVTDAVTGVTLTSPTLVTPVVNQQFKFIEQPVTLTVKNAVTTGTTALTYLFEVATDAAFATKVYTKDGVAEGAGGQTSLKIDTLPGPLAKTYFWRARVNSGSLAGPFTTGRAFGVGPQVVLGTPSLAAPVNGAQAFSPVALTITNITRTGPAGAIVYTVDVARDSGFASIIYTANVAEGGDGQTVATLSSTVLQGGSTYFWRAKATDATNNLATPYSATASFVAQSFNFATAKIWDNPPDVAAWQETAKITRIDFTGDAMEVDFDRRTGSNRWPDQVPPGFAGALQYTLGMCRFIDGGWHCSAVVEFWYDRPLNSTAEPSRFWREWWYDSARWGALAQSRPVEGELVGVFVGAGDLRGRAWTRATCPGLCERSNVQFVPFTEGFAQHSYSNGGVTASSAVRSKR